MPYFIRKLPNKDLYRVYQKGGIIKSHGTTLEKAKAQVRLLHMKETNVIIPKKEFVKEHKHLIKILGKTKEGKKQEKELKKILKK